MPSSSSFQLSRSSPYSSKRQDQIGLQSKSRHSSSKSTPEDISVEEMDDEIEIDMEDNNDDHDALEVWATLQQNSDQFYRHLVSLHELIVASGDECASHAQIGTGILELVETFDILATLDIWNAMIQDHHEPSSVMKARPAQVKSWTYLSQVLARGEHELEELSREYLRVKKKWFVGLRTHDQLDRQKVQFQRTYGIIQRRLKLVHRTSLVSSNNNNNNNNEQQQQQQQSNTKSFSIKSVDHDHEDGSTTRDRDPDHHLCYGNPEDRPINSQYVKEQRKKLQRQARA